MTKTKPQTIRLAVQGLIGGVSQQPNSNRSENQCEVQDDAFCSVVDGLGKRQPTEHIENVTRGDAFADQDGLWPNLNPAVSTGRRPFVHWMEISPTERYMCLIHRGLIPYIQVWDALTGTQMRVRGLNKALSATVAALEYIGAAGTGAFGDPFNELEATTVGDRTWIVNKTKTVKMDGSAEFLSDSLQVNKPGVGQPVYKSKSSRRMFLFLRSAAHLNNFAVRLRFLTSIKHPIGVFRGVWDPPEFKAGSTVLADPAHVKTFSGDAELYQFGQRTNTGSGGGFTPYAGAGQAKDSPPYDPEKGWHAGRQIHTVQLAETLKRLFNIIPEPWDPDPKINDFITRDNGGLTWTHHFTTRYLEAGELPLDILRTDLDKDPPQIGSVLKMELQVKYDWTAFYREEISCEVIEQGDGTENLIAFSDEVQRIDQLPLECQHGQVVKITGVDVNDKDGYYVRFRVTANGFKPSPYPNDDMGKGIWEESEGPLVDTRIDADTMPHSLLRIKDASAPGGYRFEFAATEWDHRQAGDDVTNAAPSFVGGQIDDIFQHRNRLGILSGSRVVMSQADEPTNFWRTTVKLLLDSDPIDLDAGHSETANLRYAAAFEHNLIVFADHTQFLQEGNPVLTPRTATIVASTHYDSLKDLKPLPMERGVFFGYQTGNENFSRVRQLLRVPNTESFHAFDVTGQVPRYIKGKIVEMTGTSLESVLVVRTDDVNSKHIVWVYKWMDRGDDRILSSWMRYRIGREGTTDVLAMKFWNDDLYMLVKRDSSKDLSGPAYSICLEKMTFTGQRTVDQALTGSSHTESGEDMAFRCLLDRRLRSDQCTFSYDQTNLTCDITLPYLLEGLGNVILDARIVTRLETNTGPAGEQFAFTYAVTTGAAGPHLERSILRVTDEQKTLYNALVASTARLFIGQSYTMEYQFSEPTIREVTRRGSIQDMKYGRLQLLRGHLSLEDTGYCEMVVAPSVHTDGTAKIDKPTRTYKHPILKTGLGKTFLGAVNVRDEVLQFPIKSKPDEVRLRIENPSPYPSNPKSLEIEAIWSTRSKMYRG